MSCGRALTGGESVVIARWPGVTAPGGAAPGSTGLPALPADAGAEAEVGALMRLVTQVRRFRSDQGLRPGQPVPAVLAGIEATPLAAHEAQVRALTRLTSPEGAFTPTASIQAEGVSVELDTAAGLDIAAERRRAEKDLAAARAEIEATSRKLGEPRVRGQGPARGGGQATGTGWPPRRMRPAA